MSALPEGGWWGKHNYPLGYCVFEDDMLRLGIWPDLVLKLMLDESSVFN